HDWNLRRDVLRGGPARARDRHTYGSGRAGPRRDEAGDQTGNGPGLDRRGDRIGGFIGGVAISEKFSFWPERTRSNDVWDDSAAACRSCAAGVLHPGAAGGDGGPDDYTSI